MTIATKKLPTVPLNERLTLTLPEVALLTGLTMTLITEAVAAGLLRSTKIGKRRMVYREALDKFLARGERKPLRVRDAYRRVRVRIAVARGEGR